jgi:hypothetical protein
MPGLHFGKAGIVSARLRAMLVAAHIPDDICTELIITGADGQKLSQ